MLSTGWNDVVINYLCRDFTLVTAGSYDVSPSWTIFEIGELQNVATDIIRMQRKKNFVCGCYVVQPACGDICYMISAESHGG
jgi:hypothetical protein